ncbi:MAG: hypothetical protein RSB76_03330 [Clostridia bacterium]
MIKISCKCTSKYNSKRIDNIIKKLPKVVGLGVENAIQETQKYALHLKPGKDQGILFEMLNTDTNEIKGRVYTDTEVFPWAWFVEYGTGKYAELEHIGTSKTFIESGFEYWFIPVGKVSEALNYPIINIKGTLFYLAHGVPARPYMRPASFERRDQNVENVEKEISKMLQEVCR